MIDCAQAKWLDIVIMTFLTFYKRDLLNTINMLHKWQSLYLQPCTGLYEHIILGSVPAFYSRAKFKIVILEIIVYFLVLMCIFCRLVKISSFQISIVINIIYFGLKCPKCNFLLNRQELNCHRLCTTAGVRPKKDKKNPKQKNQEVLCFLPPSLVST